MPRVGHERETRAASAPPEAVACPAVERALTELAAPDAGARTSGVIDILRGEEVSRYTKTLMLRNLGLSPEGRIILGQILGENEAMPETIRLKAAHAFHKGAPREFINFLGRQPLEAASREVGIRALGRDIDQEALRFLGKNLVPGYVRLSYSALLAISDGISRFEGRIPFSVAAAEVAGSIFKYVGREGLGLPQATGGAAILHATGGVAQFFDRESLRAAALGAVALLTHGNDRSLGAMATSPRGVAGANLIPLEILKDRKSPELPLVVDSLLAHTRSPRALTRLLDHFSAIGIDSPEIEQKFLDRRGQMLGARLEAAFERIKVPFPSWANRIYFGALEDSFSSLREVRERREEDRLFWGTGGTR